MQKFRIFIGSSSEGSEIANELRTKLAAVAEAAIWTGIFHLGDTSIESLFAELRKATHAVLVATADDSAKVRGKRYSTPRDNVIFELGLFMGRLGRKRTYLIAERSLKLPSDLAGLTIAHFEIDRVANSFNVDKAIAELIAAIKYEAVDEDANLIDSFLRIIDRERVGLRTTYEQLLRLRFGEISAEISSLKKSKDWHRLLAVKALLREYLEHSGAYHDAIRFGEYYSEALHNLGRLFEDAWSRVKDIGYMNILAGRHSEGRRVIQAVVLKRNLWEVGVGDNEVNELLVYAYRYLAISYHRDMVSGDIAKARHQLELASEHVARIPADTTKRALLDARVDRNRAHLLVSAGKCDEALGIYERCLVPLGISTSQST